MERKRGCGYRKIGALYLVTDGPGRACDRLPFPLVVCPTCSAGFKHSLGFTWVDTDRLFGRHEGCQETPTCPLCEPAVGRAGLLWVGARFYPSVVNFQEEAREMGVSRRIQTIPHGFKLGTTWILLAHPRAIEGDGPSRPGIFMLFRPTRIEMLVTDSQSRDREFTDRLEGRGITPVVVPDGDPNHLGSVWDDLRSGAL